MITECLKNCFILLINYLSASLVVDSSWGGNLNNYFVNLLGKTNNVIIFCIFVMNE